MTENKLTDKQQAFVEAYLANGFNAYRAALTAGYTGNPETLRSIGSQNLTKPAIRSAIDERMNAMAMGATEVLVRLSEHASADMGEFMGYEWGELATHPQSRLIKKAKRTLRTEKDGAVTEYTEIELHDSQTALAHLGRYHKLFAERVEHTGKDGGAIKFYGGWTPDEWDNEGDATN